MNVVEFTNVTVDLPVYTVSARSLRRTILSLPAGGRMMRDKADRVVVRALDGVSFRLEEGDHLGLFGHNGSGKTTLLRTIAGVYAPSAGLVEVHGTISVALDVHGGMDMEATGEENVHLLARYRGFTGAEVRAAMPDIVEFSELGAYMKIPVKAYSAGMMARLSFSVATSFAPDILLMDEWLAAGDARFIQKAEERLRSFVSRSRALVLATHNTSILRAVCNKVAVFDKGKLVALGPTEEVLAEHTEPPRSEPEPVPEPTPEGLTA